MQFGADVLHFLLFPKKFCHDMAASKSSLHLTTTTWIAFFMLVAVLELAKIATKSMQYEQRIFGDFFGIWLN